MFQGITFPYPTKKGMRSVQAAMRPIQLWEMIFPKENLKDVLKMLHYEGNRKDVGLQFTALRKVLGAKKLPKFDYSKLKTLNYVNHKGNIFPVEGRFDDLLRTVAVYPIGYRPDKGIWEGGEYEGGEKL